MSDSLIIIAHSARALAESAARAGYEVVTVDGFADLDTLEASAECVCLPLVDGGFVKSKLVTCLNRLGKKYPKARVLLGAGAEYLVNELDGHAQWKICAAAEFINQVIHPKIFFQCLDRLSIPYPEVSFERPSLSVPWLYKQFNSCGGVGVTKDDRGTDGYWQREIKGMPVSALCIASLNEVRVIGMNRQLTQAFSEAYPYVYCGAIANYELEEENILKTVSYLNNLRKEINLLGVFSLDMIVAAGQLYVLEINPRIAASFELYEQLNNGLNLVDAHNRVCEGERLPEFALTNCIAAYRIIYAQCNQVIRSGICWPEWVKDRPESGRNIQSMEPICSIHASGTGPHVLTFLNQREEELYSLLNNKLYKQSKLK